MLGLHFRDIKEHTRGLIVTLHPLNKNTPLERSGVVNYKSVFYNNRTVYSDSCAVELWRVSILAHTRRHTKDSCINIDNKREKRNV
jgi:hypothetical protein